MGRFENFRGEAHFKESQTIKAVRIKLQTCQKNHPCLLKATAPLQIDGTGQF